MTLRDFSQAADGIAADVMMVPTHLRFELRPAAQNARQDIHVPVLKVTSLPSAMRKMGWSVSAALMERWFASPAWRMPENWKGKNSTMPPATEIGAPYVDESIVTMEWALGFSRCRKAYEELLGKVANPAAVSLLGRRLTKAKWDKKTNQRLGDRSMSARELDQFCQVNIKKFGSLTDTLDDLYGALGVASMKIAVVGEACVDFLSGRECFHVEAAGTYIRDFYDFNGSQFLGFWSEDRVLSKRDLVTHGMLEMKILEAKGERVGLVTNGSFDAFRSRYDRGGDFVVFSDVHWTPLDLWIDLEIDQ